MAEVGEKADVSSARANQKTHGIHGVVRDAERVHLHVANFETVARGEDAAIEFCLQNLFDGGLGVAIAIDGDVQLRTEDREAVDVVGMFVSDEDAGESLGGATDFGEALAGLSGAESRVDE